MRIRPVIRHVNKRVLIQDMPSKSINSLSRDFGVNYFDDFEIDIESRAIKAETGAINLVFMLSNSRTPGYNTASSIYAGWKAVGTNSVKMVLGRDNATEESVTTEPLEINKRYYLRIKRKAATNSITMQIHTHKSRVSSCRFDTLSISHNTTKFRVVSIGAAGEQGGSARFTGIHENLNLNEHSYTLKQSNFRFRKDDGNESDATWRTDYNSAVTSEIDVNTRIRLGIELVTYPIVEEHFSVYSAITQWSGVGAVSVTGGYLSCSISGGAGTNSIVHAIPECTNCFYDFTYSWGITGSGWSRGTSNYILINALATDSIYIAAFAVNTDTGKVGIFYEGNDGSFVDWSNASEEKYEDNEYSKVRLYFKKATRGAYPTANGIIKLWYNDVLVIDRDDINNAEVDNIVLVTAGGTYCDGDLEGELIIYGVKVYKPCLFNKPLQLEYRSATDTSDHPWKKIKPLEE